MFFLRGLTSVTALMLLVISGMLFVARQGEAPYFIAFVSRRDRNSEIYLMNPEGGGLRNLTRHLAEDYEPAFSPDGRWIAYLSYRDSNPTTYLMRLNGAFSQVLTPYKLFNAPTWSPDGQWIAVQDGRFGPWVIAVVRAGDTALDSLQSLTYFSMETDDWAPAWSPDGEWIAFSSNRDGNREIYRIRPDGSGLKRLTYTSSTADAPVWSPDGQWIMFKSDLSNNWDTYRMRADGSELENLTHSLGIRGNRPVWSMDSRWIAFESRQDGNAEIYRIRPDGTGLQRLTNHPAEDSSPAFSPPINLPWRFWLNGAVGVILLAAGVRFSVRKGG